MRERLARWTFTRRKRTLLIWVVAFIGIIVIGSKAGGDYERNFSLPGAESQQALDLLKSRFPSHAGGTVDIVFRARGGVAAPTVRAAVERVLAEMRALPGIDDIASPFPTC